MKIQGSCFIHRSIAVSVDRKKFPRHTHLSLRKIREGMHSSIILCAQKFFFFIPKKKKNTRQILLFIFPVLLILQLKL